MFADDSNIFISGSDLKVIEQNANRALILITEWLCAKRLSLNVNKTNFMIFSPKRNEPKHDICIKIGETQIEEVDQCKFLGIIVDNKLNWKDHIKYL